MSSDTTRKALDRIERAQRLFQWALSGALILEALLIAVLVLLVDFSDRLQALVFVATIGGYTLMTLGLIILACHLDRTVLRASQLSGQP